MHQVSTIHGLMRFFQRLAHRLEAHALDQATDDQLVGQQLQGPVAAALGRITAGQFDQALLDVPLDLDLVGARRLPPARQGEVQPQGDQLLADTGNRPRAGPQGGHDLLVGVLLPERIIRQQEDAGVGQFTGRRFAAGNQLGQLPPFLGRQGHPVFVHGSCPFLAVLSSPGRQESRYCVYLSNEGG